jgi:hypothetical protein
MGIVRVFRRYMAMKEFGDVEDRFNGLLEGLEWFLSGSRFVSVVVSLIIRWVGRSGNTSRTFGVWYVENGMLLRSLGGDLRPVRCCLPLRCGGAGS